MSSPNPLFELLVKVYDFSKDLNREKAVELVVNAPHYYTTWWSHLLKEAPEHIMIETALCLFIVWLVFIRKTVDPTKTSKSEKLTDKEVQWLVDTWQPEPLVSSSLTETDQAILDSTITIEKVDRNYLTVQGVKEPVLNCASFDFLGIGSEESIKKTAEEALEFYGCGSCGPRGFYGTIDQHLFFENAIAKFMGTEEAISYSDGASTVSSAIPAFSKKGDLLIVDEAVSEPVLTGLNLSRSTVQFFRHNDMNHLRTILESIALDDKRLKRDTKQQRRFIVAEGMYRNTGDLCPLPEIVALKEKYFYRLILDESMSFGTIGASGRGVTEHFGVKIEDIEIVLLAMDTSLASVGGVCVGSRFIVDHQRLSGAGYCFSASSPPFLSACAIKALKIMEEEPERLQTLHDNATLLRAALTKVKGLSLHPTNCEDSPIMHLHVSEPPLNLLDEIRQVIQISEYCVEHGVAVMPNNFSLKYANNTAKADGTGVIRPSLTVNASAYLTKKEIAKIGTVLNAATKAIR